MKSGGSTIEILNSDSLQIWPKKDTGSNFYSTKTANRTIMSCNSGAVKTSLKIFSSTKKKAILGLKNASVAVVSKCIGPMVGSCFFFKAI
jgi:hypothetical protein